MKTEYCLLSALMRNPEQIQEVLELISEKSFINPGTREIFSAIKVLSAEGKPFDWMSILDYLRSGGGFEANDILTTVYDTPNTNDAVEYAKVLREHHIRRSMHRLFKKTMADLDAQRNISSVTEEFERVFTKLNSLDAKNSLSIDECMERCIVELEEDKRGIKTGLSGIDKLTDGLFPGNLVILAGRPGMGKSAIALILARNISNHVPCEFLSLEMTNQALMERLLMAHLGVGKFWLRGTKNHDQVQEAMGVFAGLPLFFNDSGRFMLQSLKSELRGMKRKHGIRVVFIDYLQLIRYEGRSKYEEITEISRELKAIAKELDICIVALSQLSRDCEKRQNKRPVMSDLRDSGQIEQDADVVIFAYRDEIYNEKTKLPGILELIVGKNREGELGTSYYQADFSMMRFYEAGELDFSQTETTELYGV